MAEKKYHKSDIAKRQLETAVKLFLSGDDCSSVITLAGAAGNILDRLVQNAGKEAFVDYARRVCRELSGHMPKRRSYAHHIDKRLGVIVHKHMGTEDADTVELDLEKMAFDSLARAIEDYTALNGHNDLFVRAFFGWVRKNTNTAALIDEFLKAPDKLKP